MAGTRAGAELFGLARARAEQFFLGQSRSRAVLSIDRAVTELGWLEPEHIFLVDSVSNCHKSEKKILKFKPVSFRLQY